MTSGDGLALFTRFSDVLFLLKDSKTESWQRRAETLKHVKFIFMDTLVLIMRENKLIL